MVFCIDQFSSALCMAYGTDQDTHDLPSECFYLSDNSEYIIDVIDMLQEIFKEELYSIPDIIFENETLESCRLFMKATLSKLVKLYHPSYFSFVLSCCLVMEIIYNLFRSFSCFTYAKVASLCLIGVYNRCYKQMFENSDESDTLGSACKKLNTQIKETGCQIPPNIQQQTSNLLQSLENVDYENFALTDSEEAMLEAIFDLVQPEETSEGQMSTDVSTDECDCPSDDETNLEVAMEYLNLDESDECELNKICKLCDGTCFHLFWLYRDDALKKLDHVQ